MAQGKFVSYLWVSTDKQGRSGLGLEAQSKAVEDFMNGGRWMKGKVRGAHQGLMGERLPVLRARKSHSRKSQYGTRLKSAVRR